MLIFGQNEMKDSVEWKARAESLGPSRVYCSPVEEAKPKKMYWKGKKKKSSNNWLWNRHIRKFTRKLLCFLSFIHQHGDGFPLEDLGLETHAGALRGRAGPVFFCRSRSPTWTDAGGSEEEGLQRELPSIS